MTDIDFHKKRRRVTRASLTKLSTKLTELEANTTDPDALRIAQGLASRLKTLGTEFKTHQLAIIDHTNDEEGLVAEQQALDDYDDTISELTVRIQRLISSMTPSSADELRKASARRLTRLQEKLTGIGEAINAVTDDEDDSLCTLEQYAEQVSDLKMELKDVQNRLLHIELGAEDPLLTSQNEIEHTIFKCSLAIKKRLRTMADNPPPETPTPRTPGAKLPKLEVPTFDGDILKWKCFWDQFRVSIHDRSHRLISRLRRKWSTCRMPSRITLLNALLRDSLSLGNTMRKQSSASKHDTIVHA